MQNNRNITYPSITICTKRPDIDAFFHETYCWPCEYERRANLSNMFQLLVYHYIDESGLLTNLSLIYMYESSGILLSHTGRLKEYICQELKTGFPTASETCKTGIFQTKQLVLRSIHIF